MPGSVSSSSSVGRLDTGSYHQRSSSFRSHHSRGRSPSPTEHFRNRQENSVQLEDKLFELNKFIYTGIDKFLDKQAVQDLIKSYDDEDLYPEGGLSGDEFLRSGSSDSDSFDEQVLTVVQDNDKTVIQIDAIEKMRRFKGSKHRHPKARKITGSLMDTFLGLIWVKLFSVRRNAKRRQDDGSTISFEDDHDGPVDCFCFGNFL